MGALSALVLFIFRIRNASHVTLKKDVKYVMSKVAKNVRKVTF